MKRALKPTEYVMVKAMTRSDWDYCNFALLHITNEWELVMGKRLIAL